MSDRLTAYLRGDRVGWFSSVGGLVRFDCDTQWLRAAISRIVRFEEETAIVLERYDRRVLTGGRVERLHQEDLAQATATHPASTYQNEGGPALAPRYDVATALPYDDLNTHRARLSMSFCRHDVAAETEPRHIAQEAIGGCVSGS